MSKIFRDEIMEKREYTMKKFDGKDILLPAILEWGVKFSKWSQDRGLS